MEAKDEGRKEKQQKLALGCESGRIFFPVFQVGPSPPVSDLEGHDFDFHRCGFPLTFTYF